MLSAIAVLTALNPTGCGTITNLGGGLVDANHEAPNYSGLQRDLAAIGEFANANPCSEQVTDPRVFLVMAGFMGVEVCLTAAGDTLVLPLTATLSARRVGSPDTHVIPGESRSFGKDAFSTAAAMQVP